MDIKIIGEDIEVTDGIKSYISNKISHIHFPEKMNHAEIRFGKNKNSQHVKFTAHCMKTDITIDLTAENVYSGIDELMKKLHLTINKLKEKNNLHLTSTKPKLN